MRQRFLEYKLPLGGLARRSEPFAYQASGQDSYRLFILVLASNYTASNPEKINLVKAELEKLVPITHAEAGCIQYDLHQENDHLAHLMFYDNRESNELRQAHMNAKHLAA